MMREEFDAFAKEFTACIPDADEYRQIEFVYTWYPVDISKDMMKRSIRSSECQEVIDDCREKIRKAEIDLKCLKGGEDVKESDY